MDGLQNCINRFKHGTFEERILLRNSDDSREYKRHHAHIFRKAAPGRLKTSRNPGSLIDRALGKGTMSAGVAFQARLFGCQQLAKEDVTRCEEQNGAIRESG